MANVFGADSIGRCERKEKFRTNISAHKDRHYQVSKYWYFLLNHPVTHGPLKASLYECLINV